jgi:hypothetical protein
MNTDVRSYHREVAMTVQLGFSLEPTITSENARTFIAAGFQFAERVPAEQLICRHDSYVSKYGEDNVLIGETVDLSTGLPAVHED